MPIIDTLSEFLLSQAGTPLALAVIALVTLIDGFFPPVPAETMVVALASVGAAAGAPNLVLLAVVAAVAALAGDNVAYAIGKRIGLTRFRWMRHPSFRRTVDHAERGLASRAAVYLITARFIPVARVAVNMSAGAMRFTRGRYLAITAASAALWAVYSVGIGAIAGHWFGENPMLAAVAGVALGLALGLVLDRIARALRQRQGLTATLPCPAARELAR